MHPVLFPKQASAHPDVVGHQGTHRGQAAGAAVDQRDPAPGQLHLVDPLTRLVHHQAVAQREQRHVEVDRVVEGRQLAEHPVYGIKAHGRVGKYMDYSDSELSAGDA